MKRHLAHPGIGWLLLPSVVLSAIALASTPETRPVEEQRPASADGTVEVVNVAGSVAVIGWDRPAVEVSGTIGPAVDKVDVQSQGDRTTIRVVVPADVHSEDRSAAHLTVHVPRHSGVEASIVSADYTASGLLGAQHVRSVSGGVVADTAGPAQVNTVSGDVRVRGKAPGSTDITTVSGDIDLSDAGGEVNVNTVSGDAHLALTALSKSKIETVSGDLVLETALAASGQLDLESVSGDVQLTFVGEPGAEVDLETLSGEIDNCFGPKPQSPEYGPGSRLSFKSGDGSGRVHVESRSGDIKLCTKKAR